MSHYSKEDIIRLVEEQDIKFIRLQFTDIFGILKNIAIPRSQLKKALNNEMMFDGSSIDGFARIEESDMYLRPDLDSFVVFPWNPEEEKVARLICDVYKTDGTVIELTNPSNLPPAAEIDYMEEPMVKAEIMVTSEFIGSIMDLCQERRGIYQGMEYIEETRAVLRYHLPLNEIIYDFFDALKSRSRGYASFDYEMLGYEKSELVKLDILINKEEVDALSFIVFSGSAYERGRKMCEKLKDEIPRHLFEIPIQAAIGSKVIARETVKAVRKDVLAKCCGGDISRKRKLLEKQKEGKKRMRQIGNVEIPQKAFMSVLKLDDKK